MINNSLELNGNPVEEKLVIEKNDNSFEVNDTYFKPEKNSSFIY